jgi:regulator of protease activity HflC (stomatin/prohibitin superfamily)
MNAFILIPLIGTLLLLPTILFLVAKNRMHAFFPREGTIASIVKGETFKTFVPRIEGKTVRKKPFETAPGEEEERWTIDDGESKPGLLEKLAGVYWISITYPFTHLHSMTIDARRLSEGAKKDAPISSLVEHEPKVIHELRWKFPRPVLVMGVELKDNLRIDILTFITFEVVHPYLPIFVFGGDFFELLDSAVESAIIDFCKGVTYKEFLRTSKGKGGDRGSTSISEFTERILRINDEGDIDGVPDGIIAGVGIRACDAYVYRFDLSEEDKKTQEAVQAEEIARLNAEATRRTAEGTKDANRLALEGEASGARKFMQALIDKGVDPNVAANVYRRMVETTKIGNSSLSTWVEGDGASVLVNTEKKGG